MKMEGNSNVPVSSERTRKTFMKGFTTAILTLAFFLVSPTIEHKANAQVFSFKWGSPGKGDGQFNRPVGIAIDSSGNVYISDQNNNRVQKFDMNGNFLTKWGSVGNEDGQFNGPQGIGIDFSDNVYVVDQGNNRVQKFDSEGIFILKWGTVGEDNGEFNDPQGVAIDSADFVYVTDLFNDRVQKFTSSGAFITKWGSTGSDDGRFNLPSAIAVDSLDNIYVTDSNNRVQKFDAFGVFALAWGTGGSSDGQFLDPMGLAVKSSGNVLISEWGNNRVQEFDITGTFVTKWGIFGFEDGQFDLPYGVAVQSRDRIYVADSDNNRIQVFTEPLPPAGNGTGTWLYSLTNDRITEQVGVVCVPEPDQTGTARVSQTGQYISIVTSAGDEFSGFVSGSDVNASASKPELGGISSQELVFTFSSNTEGAGVLRHSRTDNRGSFCTGEADLSLEKQTSPTGGGGGGGGGCFIRVISNGLAD